MRKTGRVRIGVLGCSDIAVRRTLPAMVAEPLLTVVAVASRQHAKAKAVADRFECAAIEGYDTLLEREDVDAVYVPLPALLHTAWIDRALRAGKHVLAEKPLTVDSEQAAHLFSLAERHQRVLVENFMFLHHSQHTHVAKLLASGAIGELRSFAARFTIPPKPAGDIRYQPDVGGGAFVDIGVYPIRAASLFLGPDLRVVGAVVRVERARDVVFGGSALLANAQGISAELTFGMEHAYANSYELRGSTGRLWVDRVFTPPATYQPVVHVSRQDHREQFVLPADDQFANVVRAFAR
ncbi:Gfo/Idh/MocA family protein, partial [Kibdelosporangium lantanae]